MKDNSDCIDENCPGILIRNRCTFCENFFSSKNKRSIDFAFKVLREQLEQSPYGDIEYIRLAEDVIQTEGSIDDVITLQALLNEMKGQIK